MKSKSPYLLHEKRLADVIAAIQVMGTYKFYKMDFSSWADRITGDNTMGDYWKKIFEDHPEFFRLDRQKQKVSLVWRRQYRKLFNVDTNEEITKEEFLKLPDKDKLRISRVPLQSDNIEALIRTAIDLHSRALEHQQDKRWWVPLAASTIGGLIGAVLGGLL